MSVRITVSICWGSVQTMSSESPKLGQVVPDHRLECHAKSLGCYLQGQGHSEGLYYQKVTVSTMSSEPMIIIFLHPYFVLCAVDRMSVCS